MAPLFHSWLHTLLREAPTPTLGWSIHRATHEARNRNGSRVTSWEGWQDWYSLWAQKTPSRAQACLPGASVSTGG